MRREKLIDALTQTALYVAAVLGAFMLGAIFQYNLDLRDYKAGTFPPVSDVQPVTIGQEG